MTTQRQRQKQKGAAILLAMVTVALVASLSIGALWQQWRAAEVERAERTRHQLEWLLHGALDWARLILIEDARAGATDHLSEPWAVPLREARLSSFLAAGDAQAATTLEAYLSGHIDDAQALLNVASLASNGRPQRVVVDAMARLFDLLQLPRDDLNLLLRGMESATAPPDIPDAAKPAVPRSAQALHPAHLRQLAWFGVRASTLEALAPYVTLLPTATPVNLNTAGFTVLRVLFAGIDTTRIQQFMAQRANRPFTTVAEALSAMGASQASNDTNLFAVGTRYFTVVGRLRLDSLVVQERSLLERDGQRVSILWRRREPAAAHLQSGPSP